MIRLTLLLLCLVHPAPPVHGQVLLDTLFQWKDYGRVSTCRLRIYAAAEGGDSARVVVLQELAENRGASTVADARYLAEEVGRHLDVDPGAALWIFHWGSFSFAGAEPERKELFLRAAFRRTRSGGLGAPAWRLVTREDVEAYTGRLYR